MTAWAYPLIAGHLATWGSIIFARRLRRGLWRLHPLVGPVLFLVASVVEGMGPSFTVMAAMCVVFLGLHVGLILDSEGA